MLHRKARPRGMDRSKAEDLFKQQVQRCETQLETYKHDELLTKALASARMALSKLQSSNKDTQSDLKEPLQDLTQKEPLQDLTQSDLKEPLHDYTQSILDSTYQEECQLVDKEFLPHGQDSVRNIVGLLNTPVVLCGNPEMALSLIGIDQVECLHWRVGALMYMYCHTIVSKESRRRNTDPHHFLECCCVGVGHLKLMLTSRTPLVPDEDYITNDSSVPELLKKGVFSDMHMLGLIYGGEMCFWSWETASSNQRRNDSPGEKERDGLASLGADAALYAVMDHLKGRPFSERWRSEFTAVQHGQDLLSKYVECARGPLKAQGWSYDRAVQLLVKLKRGMI